RRNRRERHLLHHPPENGALHYVTVRVHHVELCCLSCQNFSFAQIQSRSTDAPRQAEMLACSKNQVQPIQSLDRDWIVHSIELTDVSERKPRADMSLRDKLEWIAPNQAFVLTAILLIGAALRIYGLNSRLWYDEIVTLVESVRPPLREIVTHFP